MSSDAPQTRPLSGSTRRRWALVTGILGIVLLAAAIWAVWSQRSAASAALEAARTAPAWLVGAVVLAPIANWLLTSAVFWVLTGRYGDVRPIEMRALIGSAWLLNYIPARAGLLGRVAYHKAVNGIRVRDAATVIIQSIACTGVALAGLLAVITLTAATGGPAWTMPAGMVALGGALVGVGSLWRAHAPGSHTWRLSTAAGLRFFDVTVWGARYLAVFALAGVTATPLAIGVVTAASQASMLLPIQVGAREWVVGLAAGLTHAGTTEPVAGTGDSGSLLKAAAPGLAADLINRAAETAVAVPVGLWGTWWVVRRMKAAAASAGTAGASGLGAGGNSTDTFGVGT